MNEQTRRPRAFNLSEDQKTADVKVSSKSKKIKKENSTKSASRKPRSISSKTKIELLPDNAVDTDLKQLDEIEALNPDIPKEEKSSLSLGAIALGAFSALLMFGVGLYFENLLRELFAKHEWLGWFASVLTFIGIIALLALAIREFLGLLRLRKISSLRQMGEDAKKRDDLKLARHVAEDISSILNKNPESAKGRTDLHENMENVLDGSDIIHLIERDLLAPLDKSARKMIMDSAKRVSVVTAVSPRALVDIGFVLYENTKLIRSISKHYGGRPGKIGMWRLSKRVIAHLAATGAIAVGDGIVQQMVGHGLAAKLSARLGEGVVNGLLTARVGIAAIDVCRPLAFDHEKRPGVNDFLSELTKFGKSD